VARITGVSQQCLIKSITIKVIVILLIRRVD
jgi:hypothetical protein